MRRRSPCKAGWARMAATGLSTNRLKGVHILDHYVSMEEYNQNRDAR